MGYITWPVTPLPRWAEDRAGTLRGHSCRGPAVTGGRLVPTWPSQALDVQWGLSNTEEGLGLGGLSAGAPFPQGSQVPEELRLPQPPRAAPAFANTLAMIKVSSVLPPLSCLSPSII